MEIGRNSGWEHAAVGKLNELRDEIRLVFTGRGRRILDTIIPLLIYLLVNAFLGLQFAVWTSLGAAVLILGVRLLQEGTAVYALAGFGGVLAAAGLSLFSQSSLGFYLPGLLSGGITVLVCLISVLLKRPLAAWTSHLTRGWPREWYWQERIRPAYNEVTLFWAVGFGLRLAVEAALYLAGMSDALGLTRALLGWPFTVLILVLSYLYGIWRLGKLNGPSVDEYQSGQDPPWQGQKRGF